MVKLTAGLPGSSLVKPGHLLCYGIGWAGRIFPGSPVQARLFALLWYWPGWPRLPRIFISWPARPMAGLTEAFGPGFNPGLPRSDQALDAREFLLNLTGVHEQ